MCIVKRKRVKGEVFGFKAFLNDNDGLKGWFFKGISVERKVKGQVSRTRGELLYYGEKIYRPRKIYKAERIFKNSTYYGFHAYSNKSDAIICSARDAAIYRVRLFGGVLIGTDLDGVYDIYAGKKMEILNLVRG